MNFCIICGLPLGQKKKCPRCEERLKLTQEGDCEYCLSIYQSTSKSFKRKYKYCPMCGKEIDKNKFKIWRFQYE
jgi:predicted amidophosphoribosyltransferase